MYRVNSSVQAYRRMYMYPHNSPDRRTSYNAINQPRDRACCWGRTLGSLAPLSSTITAAVGPTLAARWIRTMRSHVG